MFKQGRNVIAAFSLTFLLLAPAFLFAAETLTITTYYPSPYGSYYDLYVADKLGIGTTSPNNLLELYGGSSVPRIRFTDTSNDDWLIGTDSTDKFIIRNITDSNTDRLVIDGSGNVGIGTTAPGKLLHVAQANQWSKFESTTTTNYGLVDITNTTNTLRLGIESNTGGGLVTGSTAYNSVIGSTGNYGLHLITNAAIRATIDNSGNVGIGTTPTYQLELSTDSAAKPSTNAWTISSDIRIKKDIRPYTNGLSIIKRIKPVWFKYNGKGGFPDDNQDHIGVIAQEVIKVAPYTINSYRAKLNPNDKKETELLNFNSHAFTFDLINAVKELDSSITRLTQENQELKKSNKELKSELERFKERLSHLEAKVK